MPGDPVFYPDDYEGYPILPEDEYVGGFRVTRDRGLFFWMAKGKFMGADYAQRIAAVRRRGQIPGAGDWWIWISDDSNLTIRVTRKNGTCTVSSNTVGSTLLTAEPHGLSVGQSFTTTTSEGGLPTGIHYVVGIPNPKSLIVSATANGPPRVLNGNGATSILIQGGNNVAIKSVLGSTITCTNPHGIILTKGVLRWESATLNGLTQFMDYSVPLARAITATKFILPAGVNLTGGVTGSFTVNIIPDYTSFACAVVTADAQQILSITDVRPPFFLRPFSIMDGIPEATENSRGIVRLATQPEANGLLEGEAVVTPRRLPLSSMTQRGLVELAEHSDMTSDDKAITPAYLQDLIDNDPNPFTTGDRTYVVGSQSAMLALAAKRGDVAVRSDESKSYRLMATPATVLSNWTNIAIYGLSGNQTYLVNGLAEMLSLPASIGDIAKRIDENSCYRLKAFPASNESNWVNISGGSAGMMFSKIIALR